MRGMERCLHDHLASASSSEESQTEDPEFMPSSEGEETKESQMKLRKGEEMERQLFVLLVIPANGFGSANKWRRNAAPAIAMASFSIFFQ